nr:EOG090X09CU [Scapholeberis mucronata]
MSFDFGGNSCTRQRSLILLLIAVSAISLCQAANKYSKEANQPEVTVNEPEETSWKTIDKPFRVAKLNLVWAKAQKRLTEFKLKTLYSELKVQDKEELQLKRFKADNLDRDGLKEAELRKKFAGILGRFGLDDHFDKATFQVDPDMSNSVSNHQNIFKDKKLNKLWLKAESAGFTETELKTLKEEFVHHQEKVLEFYSLLDEHNNAFVNEAYFDNLQDLDEGTEKLVDNPAVEGVRSSHRELKHGYDRLERMTLLGPKSRDFEEPKVQGLWKIALKGDFSPEELESLRTELRHYEQRLLKLRFLQNQKNKSDLTSDESNNRSEIIDAKELGQRIKLQSRKVEKLHADLEARITQRHLEL